MLLRHGKHARALAQKAPLSEHARASRARGARRSTVQLEGVEQACWAVVETLNGDRRLRVVMNSGERLDGAVCERCLNAASRAATLGREGRPPKRGNAYGPLFW